MTVQYTGSDWISQLPELERNATLARMRTITLKKGDVIYAQGVTHDALWQLRSGTVRVTNQTPDGKEVIFAIFYSGDCFGEICLLDGLPAANTAVAIEQVELAELKKSDFDELYRDYPVIADQLTRLMCSRVRHMLAFYTDVTLLSLEQRMANRILYISSDHPSPGVAGELQFTQQDLANMVGATRQAVSKVLNKWREEDVISLEYGRIKVLLPKVLEDIVRGDKK